ncbi:MAG: SDR family NAD(P)-dependent oxidoreductase [Spirochaetales bacterium]|nr:SDR family NAD(P)-dependent oxidoreductase [Spirochaetales bacterium]
MKINLTGKTALVTGGAGGIGRAISRTLAAAGAKVVIVCRDAAKAEETIGLIEADGGKAVYRTLDLADEKSREEGLDEIIASEGGISLLINNAGISGFMGPVSGTPLDELRSVLEVNLTAPFHLAAKVLPAMQSAGYGRIINISSVAPRVNPPFSVTYNMSKAGLNSLTSSLSREVAADGVTVNAVAPGLVLTDRIKNKRLPGLAAEKGLSEEQLLEGMKSKSDTRELTSEEELAQTVLFLCSEWARNISGEIIEVSGGYQG